MTPRRHFWWAVLLLILLTSCGNPSPTALPLTPTMPPPPGPTATGTPPGPSFAPTNRAAATAIRPTGTPPGPSFEPTNQAAVTARRTPSPRVVHLPDPGPPAVSAAHLPRLQTSGNRVVTAAGAEVVLRGANVLRSEWDGTMAFERRAIPHLARDWGATVIVRGFASGPVVAGDAVYLSLLDEHVALAAANHLYLILAYRSGAINGPIPTQPDDEATQALATLAARYRDQSQVLYALQVEPHDVAWSALRPRFEGMIDAIRAAAAPHVPLVLVPGTAWSRDVSWAIADPVRRPHVVYKVHPFHNHAYNQRYFLNAHESGLPIFVGEFGDQGTSNRSLMDMDDVRILLRELGARRIGYAAWIFDSEAEPSLIAPGPDFAPSVPYGATVREDMLARPEIPPE